MQFLPRLGTGSGKFESDDEYNGGLGGKCIIFLLIFNLLNKLF
jgi:hypothetical protein